MRGSALSLGRVFGIEVRVHASWLLAFAFVTWGLAGGYFRLVGPRQAGFGTPLALGAISALLLFGSVLIHEFSHSVVARARGLHVRDITLFIFGGVSNIGGEARTARDEFVIALVGPLTSFALAGAFSLGAQPVVAAPGLGLLFGSAGGEQTLRDSLRGVTVGQVMEAAPAVVEAGLSVREMVFEHVLGRVRRSLVVVRDGRPLGLVDVEAIGSVPRDLWPATPVEQVARPMPAPVSPDMEVADVLPSLEEATAPLPVVADERLVGLLDLAQVVRYARLRRELQVPVGTPRPATV